MNLKENRIYFGFFLIYFTLSIFDAYFIIYIPLYYLNILNVNRIELAFIQGLTYLTLFVTPFLGFLYDKYIKKEIQSKIILYISCISLCSCFLIFILYKEILILYGIFVFVYFFSKSMIRTVMSGLYLKIVGDSRGIKLIFITLVNLASILGYLGISLLFHFNVLSIFTLSHWDSFFILGSFLSFPIIMIIFIFGKGIRLYAIKLKNKDPSKNHEIDKTPMRFSQSKIIIMVIMYIAFILASSDLIYTYPLSSWILDKFTETGFRIYSSLYFVFIIGQIIGLYSAKFLCKKFNEKSIILVSLYSYIPLLFLLTISNFPLFMVLNFSLFILGYIIIVSYTSFITDFSSSSKYKTFKFQFLQTYSVVASIIFTPLGIILYDFIIVETLMVIACVLIGISGLLILSARFIDKIHKMKFKLKIKREKNKGYRLVLYLRKNTEMERDVKSLFNFFKDNISILNSRRIFRFYKITSKNAAIMLSLCSAINEIIPEIYFNLEESL